MNPPKCHHCRYWMNYQTGTLGTCHRYPNIVEKTRIDFCGEFQAVQTQSSPVDTQEIAEYLARRFGVPPPPAQP